MKDGFIKVAAADFTVSVADPQKNTIEIIKKIKEADAKQVNLLVFPELCITGYSCGDLFCNELLLEASLKALREIAQATEESYPTVLVGLPIRFNGKIYDCAAALSNGNVLGLVPRIYTEGRQFTSGAEIAGIETWIFDGETVPFGSQILFQHEELNGFCFAVEVGNDYSAPLSPAVSYATAGATVIAVMDASPELAGASDYRKMMLTSASSRLNCAYVYVNAPSDESTQDQVYSAHAFIAENGKNIAERPAFSKDLLLCEVDTEILLSERAKNNKFQSISDGYSVQFFSQEVCRTTLTRQYNPKPFLLNDETQMEKRAESILQAQAYGLKKRIEHVHAKRAVIGISGGLDSTLALLVAIRAMKLSGRPSEDILAVTMPCFGTSNRTKNNAITLCKELGVELKEVDITASVRQHFKDIAHSEDELDVTFENSQARERTQVLMDLANQCGGLVIGTGDLSELALGWATYNGDHMSMYGVNASIPKTLVRRLVYHEAVHASDTLKDTLLDILDTPVSPELLPVSEDGTLSQKTEDLVGPYELHDFYLYYFLRYGFSPQKILRLAEKVWGETFDRATLIHWLKTFLRRFFNQQFKRSCLPDGPKVGTVSLSPRGDWQMPTDASSALWLDQLN